MTLDEVIPVNERMTSFSFNPLKNASIAMYDLIVYVIKHKTQTVHLRQAKKHWNGSWKDMDIN